MLDPFRGGARAVRGRGNSPFRNGTGLLFFAYCPRGEGRGSFGLWRFRGLDPSSRFARTPLPSAKADGPTTPWETHRLRATAAESSGRGRGCQDDFQVRLTGNRRLWITFWSQFGGVFSGDFLGPTGLGAGVRGDFSPKDPRMVRWASADFDFFRGFFAFLGRFLPVLGPYFALFPSMLYAYLYVHNFRPPRVSRFGAKNRRI